MSTTKKDDYYHVGLTDDEVLQSREKNGVNLLTPPKRPSLWKLYLEKFEDPVVRVLLVAAVFSLIISIIENEYAETIGIIAAILLATGIGFFFEYDANKKFDLLNAVNEETLVKVIRNGHVQEIPRKDVVVDDIIILETGEEIPADGQLLEAISLQVNESNLTGEPVINKTVIEADFDEEATYASNLVMRGTTVVDGHGTMRVLHVGDATEIGKVARQSTEENLEPTPLNIQLTKLANLIGKIGFTVAGLAFLIFFVKDVLLFFDFGFAERLARVASGFRTDPQIFHDGCYFNCSSRPRRVAHERNAQPGPEYAPYALNQQSGTKDARLRDDGCYHRDLYGQNGYTDSKPDAGTRTQFLRNQEWW